MQTHPTAIRNWQRRVAELVRAAFAPIPRITIDEWADRYRFLSETNSAHPGPWNTEFVPFIRGILQVITDPTVDVVVIQKCAQVSYTEGVIGNTIGYHVHQRPRSMLVVQPSKEDAEDWSKDKLQGLIDATPVLRERLGVGASDTILTKSFAGGTLKVVGGTSPKGLRRTSAPLVIVDEADGLPRSAAEEGGPIDIVMKRLTSFWDGKAIIGSTPTNEGESAIADFHEATDQRKYFVPCPHCGERQVLRWGGPKHPYGVKFEYREAGRRKLVKPETVFYLCERGCVIEEREKYAMVAAGEWRATAAETANPGWVGFHINALISPFEKVRWHRLAQEFLDSKEDHDKLKVFVNTRLGEVWKVPGTAVAARALEDRAERWQDAQGRLIEVPDGVGVLTAAVDVQENRLEVEVKGWGAEEESWVIMHHRIYGDPSVRMGPVWQELEAIRTRTWRHRSGAKLRIPIMCIDSGYLKNEVYAFVAPRQKQGVYAVKGNNPDQTEPIRRSKSKNRDGVNLVLVGNVPMKDTLFPRLRKTLRADGSAPPGYIHFRAEDATWHSGADSEYFAQFEREKVVWERVPGGARRRIYKNLSNKPVEAIDLEVYSLAALHLLGPIHRANLALYAEQLSGFGKLDQPALTLPAKRRRRMRSRGVQV